MSSYAFTLPFGLEDDTAKIILGQRQLIQKREGGKDIRGTIPEWAGQWGLIGGAADQNETPQAAAVRTFKEQTGLDLSDADVTTNFLLENQSLIALETENLTPFNVLCLFTNMASLNLLESVITDTISTVQASEGTLRQAEVISVSDARGKLGPTTPPPKGWRDFLIQNYFGGNPPGQLNTDIDILTTQITRSAAQDNNFFTAALGSEMAH